MKVLSLFVILFIVHLATTVIINTAFVPDEYWQSLEVAHFLVFGYGYLTWEWQEAIRSFLYPYVIASLYALLKLFNLDSVENTIFLPRVLQALISTLGDTFLCLWISREYCGTQLQGVLGVCTSWFWLFCSSRTLINTLETSLTCITLYYFPWKTKTPKHETTTFVWLIGLSCMMRPTTLIPWIPLCLHHILCSVNIKRTILYCYIPPILTCVAALTLIDSYCYGRLVVSPLNFLFVNVMKNIAGFYGQHPLHWYFLSGLPTVLGLHIIPFVLGCVSIATSARGARTERLLLLSILWTLSVYSALPHKEARFILSISPMCLFISTSWLSNAYRRGMRLVVATAYTMLLFSSVAMCGYFGSFHQRGTLEVMREIARDAASDLPHRTSVLFLMPCHSTPLYSHLHVNVSTRFLTCDPRDVTEDHALDEADRFFAEPQDWLNENMGNFTASHVVLYDVLYKQVASFLSAKRYKVFSCIFHAHLAEGRVGKYIYLLKEMF